jgi:hypothetical protein
MWQKTAATDAVTASVPLEEIKGYLKLEAMIPAFRLPFIMSQQDKKTGLLGSRSFTLITHVILSISCSQGFYALS